MRIIKLLCILSLISLAVSIILYLMYYLVYGGRIVCNDKLSSSYALCASYWEQQTNAIRNMWSFQKWANHSCGISVVEPFAGLSVLEFPRVITKEHDLNNSLRFSDYFDLEYWTSRTAKRGVPRLVSWEKYIEYSTRKVVVVILSYDVFPVGGYVGSEIKTHRGCAEEFKKFYEGTPGLLLKRYNYEVVKNVCIAFHQQNEEPISLHDFNSYILDGHSQLDYWFSYCRGIQSNRMAINERSIERDYGGAGNVLSMVEPSPRIVENSKSYVKNVLKVNFGEYNAVVFRLAQRKNVLMYSGYSRKEIMEYFLKCANRIEGILESLGSKVNFLAIDLGKFGDLTSGNYFDYDSHNKYDGKGMKLFQQVLTAVYGNKTIEDYHEDFVKAANGVTDRGYIGAMQKTIAERSKCLLVIGGHSAFQNNLIQHHRWFNCVKYLCFEEAL